MFSFKKNEKKINELSLSLAGIFQSAALVRNLAKMGQVETSVFDTSIQSIYHINADNVEQIYGNVSGLYLGFRSLINVLNHSKIASNKDITRYLIGLIHLERQLNQSPDIKQNLTRRIRHAVYQANYFSADPKLVIDNLADIYSATLGNLSFRLHIIGNEKYLSQPSIVNKVRAILLAGVRSVVLWRQLGGSRWHFFFMRNHLIVASKRFLLSSS